MIEERGWGILNGSTTGDEERELTYVGPRGEGSVIDYGIANGAALTKITRFKIDERTESDHFPISVNLSDNRDKTEERNKTRRRTDWSKIGIEKYRERIKDQRFGGTKIEEEIEDMTTKIKDCKQTKQITERHYIKRNNWWDKDCKRWKEDVKTTLKKWEKGQERKEEYLKKRKEYRELCRNKKEESRRREEEAVKHIFREQEVWEYINKDRKKKIIIEEKIGI